MTLGLNSLKNWIKGWNRPEPPPEPPAEWPETCLLMLLEPQLKLGIATRGEIQALEIGKTTYEKGLCNFMFHDWLLNREGTVIGVRYCGVDRPFPDRLAGLSYLRVGKSDVEIFFSEERGVDPERSCHQSFLVEELFKADSGQYGFALSMDDLPFGAADTIRGLHTFDDALIARHTPDQVEAN